MLRDITIGQYYPTESPIHKLDPRTKIVGTLVYIVMLFFVKTFVGFLLAILFLMTVVKISKVPFKFIVKGLKPIVFLLLFTLILNLLMTKGDVIFSLWIIQITRQGLYQAAFIGLRLILLIIGSSMMTLTTTPIELTDGIERLLKPLKALHVPVHEIAMMMSIALRFIPILLEETDKIMRAQMARGADFESGNLIQRAKSMIPILVPLFLSAFRRAGELATAMEARCYRGDVGRTRMKELKYKKRDFIAYGIILAAAVIIFLTRSLPDIPAIFRSLFS